MKLKQLKVTKSASLLSDDEMKALLWLGTERF